MRILSLVFACKETGLGHWFRSLTLARAAKDRGHTVFVASDRDPKDLPHIPMQYPPSLPALDKAIATIRPDWLIVDLPHDIPGWIRGIASCRICTLNGIGYDQNDDVDLRVIQGVDDLDLPKPEIGETVKGIQYVIIRPELAKYRGMVNWWSPLIWGGAADRIGLLNRFACLMPNQPANLITVDETPIPNVIGPEQTLINVNPETNQILSLMAGAPKAIISFGMISWELAFFRKPIWTFSYTDLHLRFAKGMQSVGLVKAFDGVGLPDDKTMREFLDEPFTPWGEPPTTEGAVNVLGLLEKG